MRDSFDQVPTTELVALQADSLEYLADLAKMQVEDVELGQAYRKLVESRPILTTFGELVQSDPELAERVLQGAVQVAVGARSAALMEKSLRYRTSTQN